MPDREVQHDHLRVLQLHEGVAIVCICDLFNPKRRINECRLSVRLRFRLSTDIDVLTQEKLNVFDAASELRHCDRRCRAPGTAIGNRQEVDRRLGCNVENRPFKGMALVYEFLDLVLEKNDRIVNQGLILWRVRYWWVQRNGVKGRSGIEREGGIKRARRY